MWISADREDQARIERGCALRACTQGRLSDGRLGVKVPRRGPVSARPGARWGVEEPTVRLHTLCQLCCGKLSCCAAVRLQKYKDGIVTARLYSISCDQNDCYPSPAYMRNTPQSPESPSAPISPRLPPFPPWGRLAFSSAATSSARPRTSRVSEGWMMPSSQRRAVE